jgi:hypothetical protein
MKNSLEDHLGTPLQNEINELIGNFNTMISSFDHHLKELKLKMNQFEENLFNNEKYTQALKNILKDKDMIIPQPQN